MVGSIRVDDVGLQLAPGLGVRGGEVEQQLGTAPLGSPARVQDDSSATAHPGFATIFKSIILAPQAINPAKTSGGFTQNIALPIPPDTPASEPLPRSPNTEPEVLHSGQPEQPLADTGRPRRLRPAPPIAGHGQQTTNGLRPAKTPSTSAGRADQSSVAAERPCSVPDPGPGRIDTAMLHPAPSVLPLVPDDAPLHSTDAPTGNDTAERVGTITSAPSTPLPSPKATAHARQGGATPVQSTARQKGASADAVPVRKGRFTGIDWGSSSTVTAPVAEPRAVAAPASPPLPGPNIQEPCTLIAGPDGTSLPVIGADPTDGPVSAVVNRTVDGSDGDTTRSAPEGAVTGRDNPAPADVTARTAKPALKDLNVRAPNFEDNVAPRLLPQSALANASLVSDAGHVTAPKSMVEAPAAASIAAHSSTKVASAAVNHQIANAAIHLAGSGNQHLRLVLAPEELGAIQIHVSRHASQPILVSLTVERPETLALLRHNVSGLQAALSQAGSPIAGRQTALHQPGDVAASRPMPEHRVQLAGAPAPAPGAEGDTHSSNRGRHDHDRGRDANAPALGPDMFIVLAPAGRERDGLDITA